MVSDDQHMRDAFAEKLRAEAQFHDAMVAQVKLGRPATQDEQDTLDTLAAMAENGHKLWRASLPAQ